MNLKTNVTSGVVNSLLGTLLLVSCMSANANLDLADKHACLNCHSVAKKMVGPAFKDIAAKYKDRKDAAEYLAGKISKGSTGVWGAIPMPPMASVPASDVEALTAWIRNL
jgi:cytochrome c